MYIYIYIFKLRYLHKIENRRLQYYPSRQNKIQRICHRSLPYFKWRYNASEKKCAIITNEWYGKKSYIVHKNIGDTRDIFRALFGFTDFTGNYSHARKFSKTNWLCLCQETTENKSHLLSGKCKVYGDLTEKFGDLQEDSNLVSFFRSVLDRRDCTEEEDFSVHDTLGASSVLGLPGIRTRRLEDLCSQAD